MLTQAIPSYRLPREVMAREIRMIENMGVNITTETKLGRDFTLQDLRDRGYEAVFLGVGAPQSIGLGIPGEGAAGVDDSLEFLQRYNVRGNAKVGRKVIVVGGGNAAIDAARTALRLGSEEVTIVYRRNQEQMPAYKEEIEEAVVEGVRIKDLTQPVEVVTDANGKVKGLNCTAMILGEFDRQGRRRALKEGGETFFLEADQVITAIGQRLDARDLTGSLDVVLTPQGFLKADPRTGKTSVPWLFTGGDASSGPASVVTAIGEGERAAVGIDVLFTGKDHAFWRDAQPVKTAFDPDADPVPYPREKPPLTPVERRRSNFDEVELPWTEGVALRQSARCLRCDYGKPCVTREVING
jgi:NADH-quinone oxidoreductase subunit F